MSIIFGREHFITNFIGMLKNYGNIFIFFLILVISIVLIPSWYFSKVMSVNIEKKGGLIKKLFSLFLILYSICCISFLLEVVYSLARKSDVGGYIGLIMCGVFFVLLHGLTYGFRRKCSGVGPK